MRHAAKDLAAKDAVAAKKEIARVERAERAASAKEKAAHKEAQKREELSSGENQIENWFKHKTAAAKKVANQVAS
ncbi:hypothetical protein CYMTET_48721 [Cymbomonas tetramitiformis]|uniref:Uncharacterized protein n=1 Tax=Cymbomonas tetramitiformis TaxID=36881 RepID=A0AAE0EV99_9CHLO|nr:hypothetical protein CYMTET_48721 [Cymbomonas tetramitiformis]